MPYRHILFATAAAALLALPAFASPYVDLVAGRSTADVDCSGTTACDKNSTALRATVGYAFTPHLAAEFSYADFGKLHASAVVPGVGGVDASARLRSAGLGVAGTLPLGDSWALGARLGVASNRSTVSGNGASETQTSTEPYVGISGRYALSKTVALGLALDHTRASYDGEKTDVVSLGLGLRLVF